MKNPFKRFGLKGFLLEEFAFGNLLANKVGINLLGFNQRHHSFVVNVFPLLQNSIFRYAAFNNKTGFYTSPVGSENVCLQSVADHQNLFFRNIFKSS